MIDLVLGPYRAIEDALIKDLLACRRENPWAPLLVLSPSARQLDRLQRQLAHRESALLNVEFLTFYALAERLLDQTLETEPVIRDSAFYREIIKSLLLNETGEIQLLSGKYLRGETHSLPRGLASALSGSVRDLRDAGARVVDVLKVTLEGHLQEEGLEAAPTLELFARLYEVLQKYGLRTPADQLRRAATHLVEKKPLQKHAGLFLYGFYDLTGVQLDFALAFAEHANTHFYLPYIPDHPAYLFAERLVRDPALVRKTSTTRVITAPDPVPITEAWTCSGHYDEVYLTAKKILSLVDEGIPFSQIAVITRSLDSYHPLMREVFQAHAIPYVMSNAEPVGAYPLVKAARRLLSLDLEDYATSSVFDILRSPYFNPVPVFGVTKQDLFTPLQWEPMARLAGVTTGWSSWNTRLEHWARQGAPSHFLELFSLDDRNFSAKDSSANLLKLLSAIHQDHQQNLESSWGAHARWAQGLLRRWFQLPVQATKEETILWRGLLDAVESLQGLDVLGTTVRRQRFLEALEEKLDSLELPLVASDNAGVQILDIMAARGQRYQCAFILGLNEKSFPRLIREDPFLSDTARARLASALGCRLGRKLDGYQEERMLFELAMTIADERLFLLAQRSDEEGKALIPSLYLQEWMSRRKLEFRRLPRSIGEKAMLTVDEIAASALTPKEFSVASIRSGGNPSALHKALEWEFKLYQSLHHAQQEIESFVPLIGPRDGQVGARRAALQRLEDGLSPGALQELAECPFKYFGEHVLKLRALESPTAGQDLRPEVEGKLIHRILETFYRRLPSHRGALTPALLLPELDRICAEVFGSFRDTALDLYPIAWKATQRMLRERIATFVEADLTELSESGFRPQFFEEALEGLIPQLSPTLRFRGRVDRIDIDVRPEGSRYRIVDYKTGRGSSGKLKAETAILRGQYLQLPVYLGLTGVWLAERLKGTLHADSASFYHLADQKRGKESPSIQADFWERSGAALRENLEALVSLIQTGNFYIRPSKDFGYCSWCSFSQICRKEHLPTQWRSAHDPVRARVDEKLNRKAT